MTNCYAKTKLFIIQIFINYLICLGARKAFRKIMQHLLFNEILCYTRIHGIGPLGPYFFALE